MYSLNPNITVLQTCLAMHQGLMEMLMSNKLNEKPTVKSEALGAAVSVASDGEPDQLSPWELGGKPRSLAPKTMSPQTMTMS
jgi:hypothetical protein